MTQKIKFGDMVRFKDEENPVFGVVLEEAKIHDQVTVQFICDEEAAVVYANDLEFIPHPDTARLDWMILRDYPGDMSAEDRAFTLQAERENIDTYIRLAAEQGATA
ncbi:hypothetical protein A7P89_07460 [Eikenella corrodens]|uniref:Uncharacterized protein n=1 Tax=Eikenella corrodens TaxID=539 RepID=A0A1A9RP54_EIKCO|nr:hypothetical protein [Eikenella corrodens]OAM21652.1 hypothetical protein A7P89_07460 [Eikenella corrodens]